LAALSSIDTPTLFSNIGGGEREREGEGERYFKYLNRIWSCYPFLFVKGRGGEKRRGGHESAAFHLTMIWARWRHFSICSSTNSSFGRGEEKKKKGEKGRKEGSLESTVLRVAILRKDAELSLCLGCVKKRRRKKKKRGNNSRAQAGNSISRERRYILLS